MSIRNKQKYAPKVGSRITSYNVCYTKLLRNIVTPEQMQAEAQGELFLGGTSPESPGEGKKLWLPGQE